MAMCNITGYLYDATGDVLEYGILTVQLQQDMVYSGQKVVPFTITIDLSTQSPLGYVDITVFPTEGSSPAGIAYKLEFDPDPDDTTKPIKAKPGYFRNYVDVPDQASLSLGAVVSALRGQPSNSYMPIGGTLGTVGDDLTLGTGTGTNKRIIANIVGATDPEIRYNVATSEWEFSNDGTSWQGMLQGGGGSVGGDLSGTVGAATVAKIRGVTVSTTAPSATGQVLRYNTGSSQWEPSLDGSLLEDLNATELTSGTVPLARLSGIANAQIDNAAAIAWSKISKTGSSLADLTTRSATDLTTGSLALARLAQASAASRLLGRGSASGAGDYQEITLGSGLTMTGTVLSASAAAPALDDVTDVTITGAANRDLLQYNGSAWVNAATPQLTRIGVGVAADANSRINIDGQYGSLTHDAGNSGTSIGLDWINGNTQLLTLTGNCTLTLNNPLDGYRYLIALKQDGVGTRLVSWPASVKWSGGSAPVLSTSPGSVDIVTMVYFSGLGASGNYLAATNNNYTPA